LKDAAQYLGTRKDKWLSCKVIQREIENGENPAKSNNNWYNL
jgi:hypothetical protein